MTARHTDRIGVLATTLLFATAPLALPAQTPPTAAARDEVVRLAEFRVDSSQDSGYLASNATSGTRLAMPIRELPMHLEVITRDFIEDIGAVNFKEALEYSAGVVQDIVQSSNNFLFSPSGTGQQSGVLRPDGTALNIRGYNTRFVLRNGFRVDNVTDVVNIGRQELVRGPQALLYGVAALGGIVNVDPRYPSGQRQTQVRVGYGSEDFRRGEIYHTDGVWQRGRAHLNYGLGLVWQETSDYTDFNDRRILMLTPTVDWRVNERLNVFVDAEIGRLESSGFGFQDIGDAAPGNIRNELGIAANNVNIYNEGIAVARDVFRRGKEFRWSGPDTYRDQDYASITGQVNFKLTDNLQFLVGANYNRIDQTQRSLDSQSTVLNASATRPTSVGLWTDAGANPLNPSQRLWKFHQYQWSAPTIDKEIRQVRAELAYSFDLLGNPQSVLVGRQEMSLWQSEISTAMVTRSDGTDGNRSFLAYGDLNYIRYAGEKTRPFRDSQFWEWATGHYAVYHGRFWGGRINAIGGYRRDRYMVRVLNWTYGKADTAQPDSNVANWVRPASFDDIIGFNANGSAILNNPGANTGSAASSLPGDVPRSGGYRFGGKVQYEDSPNAGLSFKVSENINVFAMSGRGVFPNTGQRDGRGNPFEAERTRGVDLGIKADLWKNERGLPRVSVQAGVYRIERENAIWNVFWAPQPRSNDGTTLRSGFTGSVMVSGTGPYAYSVLNNGYTTFQRNQPITYLLPLIFVDPADRDHPRVVGAPQLNGFLLVDYASLGSAADDPLRRAMNFATVAPDFGVGFGLSNGGQGSGASGLFPNNSFLNRNSDVAYNDQSEGADVSVILNLSESYSATFTYSYTQQQVTGGFRVVDAPRSTEYDGWWSIMNVPLADRVGVYNLDESAVDLQRSVIGERTVDIPEHSVSMWNRYAFRTGRLRGLDVGLGFTWRGERLGEVALTNGLQKRNEFENQRIKPNYPSDLKLNMALGYRARLGGRDWRFQLNVNNLLDDQKDEAFGESVLFINPATGTTVSSTTAGAQRVTVPERSRIYFNPRSFRLSATVSF